MDLFYDISWECTRDGVKYSKTIKKERVFDFLHGLNSDLDEVRGRLLETKPFPSIKEAFAKVRRKESRKKVMLSAQTEVSNQNGSAFVASKPRTAPTRGDPPKDKQWCDHCNKPYHKKETRRKIHGKPAGWKGRNQRRPQAAYIIDIADGKGTNFTLTPEQLEVLQ